MWLRLSMSLTAIGAWAGGLLIGVPIAWFGVEKSMFDLLRLIAFFATGSLPIEILAVVLAFIFARQVKDEPVFWALLGFFVSFIAGIFILGWPGVFYCLVVSVPTAILFVVLVRWIPSYPRNP